MGDPIEALILDLLEWLAPRPREYSEVMDAWRTSCPRLAVWEEVNDRQFVTRGHSPALGSFVELTPLGRKHLAQHRIARPVPASEPEASSTGRTAHEAGRERG